MWGGVPNNAGAVGGGFASGGVPLPQAPTAMGSGSGGQKHDVFVGNLSFNTTEEQLYAAFSEVGRVVNVRMVIDQDTGKLRGFAFVEFDQAQSALSAIRNMNEYELNGRRLRVNFSNSSHLEALAGKLGMDMSQQPGKQQQQGRGATAGKGGGSNVSGSTGTTSTGTQTVADALKNFSKGEMYDVIAKLKEIADRDPDEARRVISGHPQLPEAILFLMSKLDMIKTPLQTTESLTAGGLMLPTATPSVAAVAQAASARPADPRAAAAAAPRVDPRQQQQQQQQQTTVPQTQQLPPPPPPPPPQQSIPAAAVATAAPVRIDPRQRADPRAAAAPVIAPVNAAVAPPPPPPPPPRMVQQQALQPPQQQQPPPPPPQQQQPMAYPNMQQQQMQPSVASLDPALVQQVLSLTPQQIQQLPPDKQQSILELRRQILSGSM